MIFSSRLLMSAAQPTVVEGYPLTFTSERNKQAKDWSITGQSIGDVGADGLYHLNVVNNSKNSFILADYSCTVGYYDATGTYKPSSNGKTAYTENYSRVRPNTTYYISSLGGYLYLTAGFYCYDKNKEWISKTSWTVTMSHLRNGCSITTPDNCYYVRFQIFIGETDEVNKIFRFSPDTFQLEEGPVATEYEIGREPITTEIVLDNQINGTVTKKSGVLPALDVCEGTNVITVEATTEPTNMSIKY